MTSPLRILFLSSEYIHPGKPLAGFFAKDQALMLQHFGTRVDVAFVEPRSLRNVSLRTLWENHFQITIGGEDSVLTVRQKGWNPWLRTVLGGLVWAWLTERLVVYYIKRFGIPDLIHAHNVFWAGYAASSIAPKYSIPYVITEHSSAFVMHKIPPAAEQYALKAFTQANQVIAVSGSLAHSIERYLCGKQSIVISNVVDTDFFSLPPVEPASRPFLFLAVANLNINKGIHVLIRAFSARFRDVQDVFLNIVGDGPQRHELETLSKTLGVERQVQFLGTLSHEQVRAAMWRAHALVLSSFHETFGVVLIEALSTGLPVIATRCGGPEDIVTPEVGRLVEAGNEGELSHALEQIFRHPGFSRKVLRDYAISRYSEKHIAEKLQGVYRTILNRGESD